MEEKLAKGASSLLDGVCVLLMLCLSPFKQPIGNFPTSLGAEYVHR